MILIYIIFLSLLLSTKANNFSTTSPNSSDSTDIEWEGSGDESGFSPTFETDVFPNNYSTQSSTLPLTEETTVSQTAAHNLVTPPPLQQPQCNTDGEYNGEYDINFWPPVAVGEYSYVNCPQGNNQASWLCIDEGVFDPNGANWTACNEWLDELEDSCPQTVENAIEMIEFISKMTLKNNTIIESQVLSQVLDIITKVQTFVDMNTSATHNELSTLEVYTNNIIETFVHVFHQKYAWINTTVEQRTELAAQILITTQSSAYTMSLQQNSSSDMIRVTNNGFYINTFFTNSGQELYFPKNISNFNTEYSVIFIPANIRFANGSHIRDTTAVGVFIDNLEDYLLGDMKDDHEINSKVLSFSLTNSSDIIRLDKEVIISHRHKTRLQFGDRIECVFWNFNTSKWSGDGCVKEDSESDLWHTVCKCNHLTNFAALMDVKGRERKTYVKSVITYVCSIVSIIGLIFSINLIIRSRHSFADISLTAQLIEMRSIITCNLCICLIITNVLVVLGMDRTEISWLCQCSSASLLYSLLSSFFWMLMEGYYIYKSLVICFDSEFKSQTLYLMGYGLPFVIFFVAFLIIYIKENILLEALFDERYNYFCWISSDHYSSHIWILIGPALFVIISNTVLVFISFKTAFNILRNSSSYDLNNENFRKKFNQIIKFIFILFVLGITWLSFLLYINQFFSYFFAYVFIVLNGSQGLFIFLYQLSISDIKERRKSFQFPISSFKRSKF